MIKDDKSESAQPFSTVMHMVRGKELTLCGVRDVESYDENSMSLLMEDGSLYLEGTNLHILHMKRKEDSQSTDGCTAQNAGEIAITGTVNALVFRDSSAVRERGGFFGWLQR